MDIKTISPKEFDFLKEEWNRLLSRSRSDNVFLRWEWIHTWWDVFNKKRSQFILTVREEGRLVGVAPFYIERTGVLGRRSIKLCSDELSPDGLDVFAEKGREKEVMRRVWSYVVDHASDWDVIVWDHLQKEAILLEESSVPGGYDHAAHSSVNCPYVKMIGDFDGYIRSRPHLKKFSLKKKAKQLFEVEHVTYKNVEDEASLAQALQGLFLLHDKRAKEKKIRTMFTSEDVKRFHNQLSRLFLQENILRLQLLYDGEKAVSAIYSFKYKNKIYCYQSGMDPDWKRLSAGMALFSLAIERAFAEGLAEFDFLKGDEGYKSLWCDAVRQETRLVVYNKSWRGFLASSTSKIKAVLRRVKHAFDGIQPAWSPARNSLK